MLRLICFSDPKTKKIAERKYRSKMAYNIFYAVLCVFSYLAAGPAKTPSPNAPDTNTNIQHQSAPTPPGGAPGIGSSGDQSESAPDITTRAASSSGSHNTRNGTSTEAAPYSSTNPFL